jgi:hypothetical protein
MEGYSAVFVVKIRHLPVSKTKLGVPKMGQIKLRWESKCGRKRIIVHMGFFPV